MESPSYYHMPLFLPGTVVEFEGKREKVNYVMVRDCILMVYLVGIDAPIDSELIRLAPTKFTLNRTYAAGAYAQNFAAKITESPSKDAENTAAEWMKGF